jgi:two-component system nitrogen regulation response regulator NtrX
MSRMSAEKRDVLILDERSESLFSLVDLVDREGFETTGVSSQNEALSCVARRKPDVLLDHVRTSGGDELGFLKKARLLSPRTRILLLSGSSPASISQGAASSGVRVEWIPEPCQDSKLLEVLERAVQAAPGK